MIFTREEALELHRQMWSDMQKELGDTPDRDARFKYKAEWIEKHFPRTYIHLKCFLCHYTNTKFGAIYSLDKEHPDSCGRYCPIKWPDGRCEDSDIAENNWDYMPISEILALPEREVET